MRRLTEDEILAVWEGVTDFSEGWTDALAELFSKIDDLMSESSDTEERHDLASIQKRILKLKSEIEDTADLAKDGQISMEDLENTFRDFGESMGILETEVLELEIEPFEDMDEEEEEEY
jgi:predicted  nucleic acid-binding Zn-ribbon protein